MTEREVLEIENSGDSIPVCIPVEGTEKVEYFIEVPSDKFVEAKSYLADQFKSAGFNRIHFKNKKQLLSAGNVLAVKGIKLVDVKGL